MQVLLWRSSLRWIWKSDKAKHARLGFLQLRPMLVSENEVEITEGQLIESRFLLLASDRAIGQRHAGINLRHRLCPAGTFRSAAHPEDRLGTGSGQPACCWRNKRPYLLLGFGRWGSSDPWLGIPVEWGQISGARVIVESTLPNMNVEPSQGAHFFHNLISFEVPYLCVTHECTGDGHRRATSTGTGSYRQPAVTESKHLRHVRLNQPVLVKVDGRTGRGAVWHAQTTEENTRP